MCIDLFMFINTLLNIQTVNRVNTKSILYVMETFSPYRAVNTLRLGYTNQSVNVV